MSGRSLGLSGALLVGLAACSPARREPEPPDGPDPNAVQEQAPPKGEQCAVVIAIVNGGIQHVDNEAAKAKAAGTSELTAMKIALGRVADEMEQTLLADPDLLRLGGFYAGVLRVQATLLEELSVALARGDQGLIDKKTDDLAKVEQQEAAIVDEINKVCPEGLRVPVAPGPAPAPGGAGPGTAPPPAPMPPAPTAPPPPSAPTP